MNGLIIFYLKGWRGEEFFVFFSLFSILCFYHVPKMFSNIFLEMFPIAPWFYPILFAQSSTLMYINWKGGLWENTFVSILQFGPKEVFPSKGIVATPLWVKCEDETHTPKSGNWESSETPATSKLDNRRQNTSPWGVLYTVGRFLKCRCPKWPRMSHLDICNPSYGQKKGRESN